VLGSFVFMAVLEPIKELIAIQVSGDEHGDRSDD
jgi:hypothetical protein